MRLLIALLFISSHFVNGQNIYVRYNQAGFKSNRAPVFVINADEQIKDLKWKVDSAGVTIAKGELGKPFTGKGDHSNFAFNYEVQVNYPFTNGLYQFVLNEQSYDFKVAAQPYVQFLPQILRYLKQQRSGDENVVDKVPGHFGDSSCTVYYKNAKSSVWEQHPDNLKVNVLGGWYDAGDYLKFTLTNAYTTYMLLRALEQGGRQFDASLKVSLKDEILFGLDYLKRCQINDSLFVIQVGDERDHNLGDRLPSEDTNPHRYAYVANSKPHFALMAATYSIASRVLFENDSIKREAFLITAEDFFKKSLDERNLAWYQKGHEVFYADKSAYDNIVLAAAELLKTTSKKIYENKIQYYSTMAGMGYWASWSDLNLHAHNLAGVYYKRSSAFALNELEYFQGIANQPNNIWNVPHEYTWGSLYSFFNVATNAKLYGELYDNDQFDYLADAVLDYTFGKNNWGVSFLASQQLSNSVRNIYSQTYKLLPDLFPTGAIAEGPGDLEGHLENKRWFSLSAESYASEAFNTQKVVFFDDNTDFQTMETTIAGLADGFFFLTCVSLMK